MNELLNQPDFPNLKENKSNMKLNSSKDIKGDQTNQNGQI
jgi:hypothetical protein